MEKANPLRLELQPPITVPKPRVLVTRSSQQSSELADRLRELGAEPILIPTIETVDPSDFAPLDSALARLNTFHWLIFTSANAVEALARRWQTDSTAPVAGSCRIAAIGAATARALQGIGLTVHLLPPQAVAESFAEALLPQVRQPDGTPTRFLLVRAEQAREHLPETLRAAGAEVTIAPAYRTVVPAGAAEAIRSLFATPANYPDAITFTSSSTARNLFALLETAGVELPQQPVGPMLASIGPVTSATLRDLGHSPHVEATEASVDSLAKKLFQTLTL